MLPYFPLPAEANPSLGLRGTRLLLGHPKKSFRTQLRAILRLSATHPVSLLFPMIGGVEEFIAAREAVESTKEELRREGQPFNPRIPDRRDDRNAFGRNHRALDRARGGFLRV